MFTLLTPERRKALKQEYRKRFFIVLLIAVSCSIFITAVFLLPSIVISKIKQKEDETTLSSLNSFSAKYGGSNIFLEESKKTTEEVSILKTPDIQPSGSISEVLKLQDSSIKIRSFQYQYNSVLSTLLIAGVANSRDDLIRFSKLLQADPKFSAAEFPISNLSVENNIDFTIKITGKF